MILRLLAEYLCWNNKQNKTKRLVQRMLLKENPNRWLVITLNHIMGPETPELYMAEFLSYLQWLL